MEIELSMTMTLKEGVDMNKLHEAIHIASGVFGLISDNLTHVRLTTPPPEEGPEPSKL